jgi:hypothetical protein
MTKILLLTFDAHLPIKIRLNRTKPYNKGYWPRGIAKPWVAAMLLCLLSFPAMAQERVQSVYICTISSCVVQMLTKNGESPMLMGDAGEGVPAMLWGSRETKEWTVVVVMPDGRECMVLAGKNLRAAPPAKQPTAKPDEKKS